jgi:hypothetical protein
MYIRPVWSPLGVVSGVFSADVIVAVDAFPVLPSGIVAIECRSEPD